jgi:hypothetical protein
MKRLRILALSGAFLAPRAASAQSSDALPLQPPRLSAHLEINSHLPGADVFADGQPIGTTPAAASFALSPGVHTIELRRPGYTTARAVVTLADGANSAVTLEPEEDATSLPSMGGVLALRLTEPGVLVTIDGHLRGIYAAPLRLARGIHHLVAQRGSFEPWARDFVIEPGRATTLAVMLSPSSEYRAQFVSRARSQRTWGVVSMIGGFVAGATGTALVVNDVHGEVGWPLVGVGAAGMALGIALFATADDPHRYDDPREGRSAACGPLHARPVFWPGGAALIGAF